MARRFLRQGTSTSYRMLLLTNTAGPTGLRAGEMFNCALAILRSWLRWTLVLVPQNTPQSLSHLAMLFATTKPLVQGTMPSTCMYCSTATGCFAPVRIAWTLRELRKYAIDKLPFPDLRHSDWGKGPEYPSPTDKNASISYQANHQQLSAAWEDHDITDPDKWHAFRHYIYKELLMAGLSSAVIEAFMRHIHGKAKCSYDTALLFGAMLVCAIALNAHATRGLADTMRTLQDTQTSYHYHLRGHRWPEALNHKTCIISFVATWRRMRRGFMSSCLSSSSIVPFSANSPRMSSGAPGVAVWADQ